MVARGFENTATRGDLKELRDDMNTRFSAVDKRLGKLDYQMDEAYDILNLQKRVQILEKAVRALASQTPK